MQLNSLKAQVAQSVDDENAKIDEVNGLQQQQGAGTAG
jgi:hypothetical protein